MLGVLWIGSEMLNNVQYLRGIAAVMVVAFHVLAPTARLDGQTAIPQFYAGQGGVDLFFVISGFIIWFTTRKGEQDPWRFLVRRLKRIIPLYWVLTILMAAIAFVLPGVMLTTVFDLQHLVASLLFVPWPHPHVSDLIPVLFVGWSLNYEMAFYLVFALTIPFVPLARGGIAVVVGLAFVGLGLAIDDTGLWDFYTEPIIIEFLFGIMIAIAFASSLRLPLPLSMGLVLGGFIAMVFLAGPELDRLYWAGLPSLMIVTGVVFWEKQRRTRPAVFPMLLGAASYAIYLSHVFVLPASQTLWTYALPQIAGGWVLIYGVSVGAACLFVGVATYLMLEIPLSTRWTLSRELALDPGRRRPPKLLATRYLQVLRP
ncbi:exopolysaccharide production (acetyltransferase) protein [Fulvimarina pelagi HTCC2506]|uniref:Exopolysaccharide production (Acetyltransferase) protein n=1 Tax=Fulvimarina pelagi HTCC2506 TaxID=314231 RepID=Q0G1F8_9HYPH|nr:acyltransferase [Fulvimarina pelagi]EAU41123.1 exopolysaccharide production (acetyltransferase) protein [Fulvimarina pelagi HTCC2506]